MIYYEYPEDIEPRDEDTNEPWPELKPGEKLDTRTPIAEQEHKFRPVKRSFFEYHKATTLRDDRLVKNENGEVDIDLQSRLLTILVPAFRKAFEYAGKRYLALEDQDGPRVVTVVKKPKSMLFIDPMLEAHFLPFRQTFDNPISKLPAQES